MIIYWPWGSWGLWINEDLCRVGSVIINPQGDGLLALCYLLFGEDVWMLCHEGYNDSACAFLEIC